MATDEIDNYRKQHRYFLIVDIEATCAHDDIIPVNEREIIEVGCVLVDTKDLCISDNFSILIKPAQHPVLTPFCTELTGIKQEDVDDAISFPQAAQSINEWIEPYSEYLFCSWGAYDLVQIHLDCDYHKIEYLFSSPVFNLKKAFFKKQRLKKQVGMKKALQLANINQDGSHHRALDDALNIAKLLSFIVGGKLIPPSPFQKTGCRSSP